jgi:hypothetical protein
MEKDKIVRAWDAFKANASADTRNLIGNVPGFVDDKLATEESDGVQRVKKMPWTPSRQILGFQFRYDEARPREAAGNTLRSAQNPPSEVG